MITAAESMNITELIGTHIASPSAVPAAGACSVLVTVMNKITGARDMPCSAWIMI